MGFEAGEEETGGQASEVCVHSVIIFLRRADALDTMHEYWRSCRCRLRLVLAVTQNWLRSGLGGGGTPTDKGHFVM